MAKKLKHTDWFDWVNLFILTILMLLIVFPFYTTVTKSFMSQKEFTQRGLVFWPNDPILGNYESVLRSAIWRSFGVTGLYTILGVIFSMFLTTTLGYGMSKKDWPGRRIVQNLIVFTMYFGGGLIPFFLVVKQMGMIDTIWSVIIPTGLSVYNMIIMRTFFESLPPDLEEAATIDGASPPLIFIKVLLPLVTPALATLTLFYAVGKWNEWFYPSLFLINYKMWPIQLFLRQVLEVNTASMDIPPEYQKQMFADGVKAASVIVTMFPIMCVYPFLQKYFIKGIMIGAIKS